MRLALRVPVAPPVTSTAVFAFGDASYNGQISRVASITRSCSRKALKELQPQPQCSFDQDWYFKGPWNTSRNRFTDNDHWQRREVGPQGCCQLIDFRLVHQFRLTDCPDCYLTNPAIGDTRSAVQ
jgi:hypothetical protein